MIKVAVFNNETEAHLAKDFLRNRDIKAEIVGSKEYSAHILGGGAGHFELMVEPINSIQARTLLDELSHPEVMTTTATPNHFRRAVFYAFVAAIVLPVIFNYASLVQCRRFWDQSDKAGLAIARVALVLALQALPLIWLSLILHSCSLTTNSNGTGFFG